MRYLRIQVQIFQASLPTLVLKMEEHKDQWFSSSVPGFGQMLC